MAVTGVGTVEETSTAYGQIQQDIPVITETTTDTESIVRQYFADIPVMIQVARCESTFQHTLADGSVLRGNVDNRDTGVMQINTFYHGDTAEQLGLNLENLYDNMEYARDLYERKGTQPWNSSASCWKRTLASL